MVSEKRRKANRHAQGRQGPVAPSSFIRTIPSAPALDRICWPPAQPGRSRARAGQHLPPVGNRTPPWRRSWYRQAGRASVPADPAGAPPRDRASQLAVAMAVAARCKL